MSEPVDLVVIGGPGAGKSEAVKALHGARVRECHDVGEALMLKAEGARVILITRPGVTNPTGIAADGAVPNVSNLTMLGWIAVRVAGYLLTGTMAPDWGDPPWPKEPT